MDIASRDIGDGCPVYIIFECGQNHNGLKSAIALVNIAKEAGGDAVKFQMIDIDALISDKTLPYTYSWTPSRDELVEESTTYYDVLKKFNMPEDSWRELIAYSQSIGIQFFATVTAPWHIDLLKECGCDTVKICSGDITYHQLLQHAAKSGMLVQLDTGNVLTAEVETAIAVIEEAGSKRIMIHHCPSGYPAEKENIHLRYINTLKSNFDYPVAFSDHNKGWDMDIAAVAMGANAIEKTITEDRFQKGDHHRFSLEKSGATWLVESIRFLEAAMGDPSKPLTVENVMSGVNGRRSIVLGKDMTRDEAVWLKDMEFKRPGTGVSPEFADRLQYKALLRDMKKGEQLDWEDVE